MANESTSLYSEKLIFNEVDSIETWEKLEGKYEENQFYIVPDPGQFVSYDIAPTEGSNNLVTSGGIYNTVKESRENYEKAADELAKAEQTYQSSVDKAVEDISGQIDADLNEKISEVNTSINKVDNRVTDLGDLTIDKIGDIKVTVRKDLGDSWLPCDGRNIDDKEYPELFDLIGPKYDKIINEANLPLNFNTPLYFINEIWITTSTKQKTSGGANYAIIYYKTELSDSTWQSKYFWDSSDITGSAISDIKTANGRILILGYKAYSNRTDIVVAELDNNFNIIREKIVYSTTDDIIQVHDVAYNGNYYAILTSHGPSGKLNHFIHYSNNFAKDWSSKQLNTNTTPNYKYYENLDYIDGSWVYSLNGARDAIVYFLTSFDSSPRGEIIYTSPNSSSGLSVSKLIKKDDYLVCTVVQYQGYGVWYKKSGENTWSQSFSKGRSSGSDPVMSRVLYDGYNFFIIGKILLNSYNYENAIAYSPSLENEDWKLIPLDFTTNTLTILYYYDKKIMIPNGKVLHHTLGTYIPNLSLESANYYIKALEEETQT